MLDEFQITPHGSTDIRRYTPGELEALRRYREVKAKNSREV
jgi:hypothetical protein